MCVCVFCIILDSWKEHDLIIRLIEKYIAILNYFETSLYSKQKEKDKIIHVLISNPA